MEIIGDMIAIAVNIFGIRQLPILKRVHQRNVNHHTGIRRELGNDPKYQQKSPKTPQNHRLRCLLV